MRIVYLGTPDFAVLPLKKLVESGEHEIVGVVTNKDKPVGRKQILTAPPVKQYALENGLPVYQYSKIRIEGVEDMKALKPDLMITCAFGQILSQEILDIAKHGVINIHASLLPKYRGASPIHYAMLNGEKKTGITIMKTDIGIDTGDMILQEELEILDGETCGSLFERLSVLGAECLMKALPLVENGTAKYIKQDEDKATFSKIVRKEHALIDWNDSAENVYNKIRAYNPAPIAFCYLDGNPFKVYEAKVVDGSGAAGQVLKAENELIIACGSSALSLLTVQKAGGKPMNIKDFLRGNKFILGSEFK
ncbi:MAG: methionyl-tRNA formyltransferase [Clostridiales bacterium]|nr:methionyl-tRNA formyltransferase [Clostridiales bacterium]